jgi:hypothetical protein
VTALGSARGLYRAMTIADRALCIAIFAGSFAVALAARATAADPPARAIVIVEGVEQAALPLAKDHVGTFAGHTGPVTVEVRGGAVAVTRSTCPHRACVAMGWKRRTGEVIACVPNELLVRVAGGASVALDAVAR